MLQHKINHLFKEQLKNWELAQKNYLALKQVKTKTLVANNREYIIQFNPSRIVSTASKSDDQSIKNRKCFLCGVNLPAEQKSILFKDDYIILVNPYPIFPRHFTIPSILHEPQLIGSRFGDMLDLAQQLDDYIVFYNGPKSGASAPEHFHFQAGNKGFLPLEKNRNMYDSINLESDNKEDIINRFNRIYNNLPLQLDDIEPKMNILTWYDTNKWIVCIFARKKHRPKCYFAEGEANLLISPGAVDMAGVFITPLEKDYLKITEKDIEDILQEIK